jgi:nucleotide-binding universal stress UspA family protein
MSPRLDARPPKDAEKPQRAFGVERMSLSPGQAMLEPRDTGKEDEMKTIVVGVDGSEDARAALAFAAHEAAAHGARLRVVCAWELSYGAYAGGFVPPPELSSSIERHAEEVAHDAAQAATELEPSIYVEHEAIHGYPAEVLIAESREATMIVVGSRGHGGFASMLLGSVSHEVAHHARCAVAIVPKVTAGREVTPEAAAKARA